MNLLKSENPYNIKNSINGYAYFLHYFTHLNNWSWSNACVVTRYCRETTTGTTSQRASVTFGWGWLFLAQWHMRDTVHGNTKQGIYQRKENVAPANDNRFTAVKSFLLLENVNETINFILHYVQFKMIFSPIDWWMNTF